MTPWELQADELVACNCAYGCPCQFNALPTHGNCQALASFEITEGHFGDTSLDGLRTVAALWWPAAIHEGNGKCFIIVDERADEAQRQALLTILSGEDTDPGATVWNVFASTMVEVFDPVFKPIEFEVNVEERTGRVFVDGLAESAGEPIRNPVTGDIHRARIDLPHGFEYSLAEMGSATFKATGPIEMSFKDCYAQFAHIHLNNHGIVKSAAA
ncbi:MAG: DUF1326 domain-containing protein [Proteobacteria bacterium]|nr:DUF1326 domain-containing protein [Pseudomonadota bacterium]MCH8302086.1 DUF1326 domain-containing protein [Pseudomonadota bacterium]